VQIVSQRTRHRHGAGLCRVVKMTMASPVSDLYPAVALKFLDYLSDFHTPQRLRQFREQRRN
jgi:hypothetical protein